MSDNPCIQAPQALPSRAHLQPQPPGPGPRHAARPCSWPGGSAGEADVMREGPFGSGVSGFVMAAHEHAALLLLGSIHACSSS